MPTYKYNRIDKPNRIIAPLIIALGLSACSGGGSREVEPGADPTADTLDCFGFCVEDQRAGNDANVSLTVTDVRTIIAQAVAEADARNVEATIAVTDRVGNVLAVWSTTAPNGRNVLIASDPDTMGGSNISGGLEGIAAPGLDLLAAIAKAVTGAYLSSEGNAFTSRTASQIVQSHFNPGELFQPGGPLFGVQFSQLACSDFISAFNNVGPSVGPQRSPLGLSADPGGFPLYKNGTVVGGVGVSADGLYSVDLSIADVDADLTDEAIALAATFGFAAPPERRANQITVEGKTFRFSDATADDLFRNPANAPAFPPRGALVAVTGYTNGLAISPGLVFGQAASGIRAASLANPDEAAFVDEDGFVFVDALNNNRFPAIDGVAIGGNELRSAEVEELLEQALTVANRARAQIRRPLSSQARVTISVVDTDGNVVGMVRTRDAPVFGADVSLQKARTAAFFSSANAAADLLTPGINASYIDLSSTPPIVASIDIADYVTDLRTFLASPTALADGAFGFSDRAGGNMSRPFFPDGIDGNNAGPLSKPAGFWSPFSTGLQLDLVYNAIIQHVLFAAGAIGVDVPTGCGGVIHNPFGNFTPSPLTTNHLANGIQIFPGSVPIYRDDVLVGGIGISGDGVDQDDMIAFLGLDQASRAPGININNAPLTMRADNLTPQGVRLRFIQCPQAPFLDSDEQQPCEGK